MPKTSPYIKITPFIIAIDGPAASGKGTLAKLIAEHYGIAHLDTGLTYRAVAAKMLEEKLDIADEMVAAKTARAISMEDLDAELLSNEIFGEISSKIAVFPEVRSILIEKQRELAYNKQQIVLDGRDIGSVVFPSANLKFFIEADLAERSKRRYLQQSNKENAKTYEEIFAALKARDERDSLRKTGPLTKSQDAYLLDTTKKSISESLTAAIAIIDKHIY